MSGGATQWSQGAAGPTLKVGDLFAGRYRATRLIGQGGMGAVYLVHDDNTGEDVCLKLIRTELLSQPGAVDRFREEGKLARRLTHEGIVKVFDIDQRDGIWFITMEFVAGRSLREWMNSRRLTGEPIALDEALWVADSVLRVLEYAHRTLVHRDIKPENIMISGEPGQPGSTLKLLDFGIARGVTSTGMTQTGQVLGSPAYMAPEQKSGATVDARVDLYAVGALLYELICGVAFDGHWEAPSEVVADCPASLDDALKSALSKFPQKRPADARSMREALVSGIRGPTDVGQSAGQHGSQSTNQHGRSDKPRELLASWLEARRTGQSFEGWFAVEQPDVDGVIKPHADRGDPDAQTLLGRCYQNGQGVAQDYAQAVAWFRKAAEQGNAHAQCNLGSCYKNGQGVAQDYAQAVAWFRKAADQGHDGAKRAIAREMWTRRRH